MRATPTWQYLRYLWNHKRYVYQAGRKLGVSRWRLLVHDWSKFLPSEFVPYRQMFYGPTLPPKGSKCSVGRWHFEVQERWTVAWSEHIHRNPHHWQHWVAVTEQGNQALEMPLVYVREMVADWCGAQRATVGNWAVEDWYVQHRTSLQLHPLTRKAVEALIRQWQANRA